MPFPPLPNPSTRDERMAGLLKAVPTVTFLSSSLLAFNMLQVQSLLLLPFSRPAFRRVNRFAADTWWGWCVSWAKGLHGTRVIYSGDEVPEQEDAIVIANHQQMTDITYLMFLARDKGRLGDMKWMVKDPVKYVPGVGWGMAFLDCIFVKRNWAADRASIDRTFAKLTRDRVPVWLLSFPEGTRLTDRKYEAGRSFAAERGLEPFDHLLVPRTKGFAASVRGLRKHISAVYDLTIGYPDGVPTLWQYIQGFTKVAHIHVRRHPVATLPEERDELAQWLMARFREKDELLEHFRRTGMFPDSLPTKARSKASAKPPRRRAQQAAVAAAL